MISILIVDDHPLIRHGLKKIMEDEDNLEVKDEAENGQQAIDLITKNDYDIIILDLQLPDKNGIEVLNEIKHIKPDTRILILSTYPEDRFAFTTIKAGAYGYVNKMMASDQLIYAIKKIYHGEFYISPTLKDKMLISIKEKTERFMSKSFNPTEFEILYLLISGLKETEIADKLLIDFPQVQKYKTEIYEKVNAKKESDLIKYVIEGIN